MIPYNVDGIIVTTCSTMLAGQGQAEPRNRRNKCHRGARRGDGLAAA